MNAYFDSSALVPLVVDEPRTQIARLTWTSARTVTTVRVAYPEVRAALARANRTGRVTHSEYNDVVRRIETRFNELDIVEIDAVLALRAGDLAEIHGLRGYDAVHLAAAERLHSSNVIVVAGDRDLIRAARSENFHVVALDF